MAGARGAARRQLVSRALRRRNRLRREWTWPRIPWRAVLGLAPFVAVAIAVPRAWQVVRTHPYFAVREVMVHHRGRLPAEQLQSALHIAPGTPIWELDTEGAEARVRALPWVRSVSVRRELPDRVAVRVREYRPAAIVAIDDVEAGLYYVAANGRIFAAVGNTDGRDLPYISGLRQADLDGRAGFGPRAVHRALGLLRLVGRDPHGMGSVSEVHADRDRGLTLLPVRPAMPIVLGWSGFSGISRSLRKTRRTFSRTRSSRCSTNGTRFAVPRAG